MSLAASEMGDRWDRASLARWTCCLMLVLAVHAGLAAAILLRKPAVELGTRVPPAIIMDLAPLPSPPTRQPAGPQPVEPPAPGPQAAPPKPVQPSTTAPKPTEPPVPAPSVSPASPKPANAIPQPLAKESMARRIIIVPRPAEPRPPAIGSKPSQKQPKARSRVTSKTASKPGTGVSNEQLLNPSALWAMQLKNHIRRYTSKTYWPGVVVVHTRIDRQGNILSLYLEQSSGNETLDGEVLTQVERASPLPPPPATIPGGILEFNLTVSFFGG